MSAKKNRNSNTLFLPPDEFVRRVEFLKNEGIAEPELLLQVELGFALMERLGLDDEPVTAVWAILSGIFIRHPRLQNLSEEDRRAIANVRQIVPFSSRFNWLNALRDYIRNIPEDWCNYDFDLQDLDDRIINAAKNLQQEANQSIVEGCLSATLEYRSRKRELVKAATSYQFEAETQVETVNLQVKFTQEQVTTVYPLPWFERVQARLPVAIDLDDLEAEAMFLDTREEILARQYSWSNATKGNWTKRFTKLNYHKVRSRNVVDRQTAPTLNIDGFTHIAGMVASGKSTLSLLLASNIIRNRPDLRITIVVGDTQSAIKIANQINWWFCDNPETDDPVAVPILGRSQRENHLQSFVNSDDYLNHLHRGQAHWGERWLSIVCPLQARISQSDRNNILNGKPLKPGTEPCHTLKKAPKDKKKTPKSNSKPCFCPLFDRCPSQQAYRDMPKARVWITTPGAMSIGGMPYHYELRPIKIGELVYEQSDIVVFDEADTIIEWFDKVYAEQLTLTDRSRNGVFDKIGVKTEQSSRTDSVRSPLKSRWRNVQRNAQTTIEATLTNLSNELGHKILQEWAQQGYFTPHVLFYKLSRRLAGLEEFNSYDKSEEQLRTDERDIQSIMDCFDDFLKDDPLLRRSSSELSTTSLLEILRRINNTGESATDRDIYDDCQNWITTFSPGTLDKLNRLKTELNNLRTHPDAQDLYPYLTKEEDIDTLDTLTHRLQFTLTIVLLDRHVNIVFYEWQNRPDNINEPSPHKNMPRAMINILPLPVTGRQFGTYYSAKNSDTLSLFAYSNIGRDYVLNFHRLLTDFDGQRGANVLALSGTSYLPDSTTFHVSDPQGVLMPETSAQSAIKQSQFKFIPQFNDRNKPMRMSGNLSNKKIACPKFQELAKLLTTNEGSNHLILELQALKELGEKDPELWQNRARILVLVNSYEQGKWVADEMRRCRSDISQQIYHLVSDTEQTKDGKSQPGELKRADIETFGHHQGKILVAPTSSIGRGFNILNSNGKAAFGAVYFLTRPFPHPHDTQAIAQEMNRRAYEWLEKEDFIAWRQGDGVAHRAELLRKTANTYWRSVEQRSYYKTLRDNNDLCAFPRYDLAATTLGRIIQAVGRLIRGGVPFHGYFVDSAWADNSAKKLAAIRVGDDPDSMENDTEENSLLVATILRICDYAAEDNSVGNALYKPLADALENIEDVFY
jgi:pPIWI RE three-gene island domain Z